MLAKNCGEAVQTSGFAMQGAKQCCMPSGMHSLQEEQQWRPSIGLVSHASPGKLLLQLASSSRRSASNARARGNAPMQAQNDRF